MIHTNPHRQRVSMIDHSYAPKTLYQLCCEEMAELNRVVATTSRCSIGMDGEAHSKQFCCVWYYEIQCSYPYVR